MKEDERGCDGEWEDETASDLVKGGIDVFESVVAETVALC